MYIYIYFVELDCIVRALTMAASSTQVVMRSVMLALSAKRVNYS